MRQASERRPLTAPAGWVDLAVVLGWYALTRLGAVILGVVPDSSMPAMLWQLLPLELLETRLGESLWHLHSQPPLFNAFVGLLLKAPGDYLLHWRITWIVIGAGFPLAMFWCLRAVNARRSVAHALTLVVCLNPTFVLYENYLLYAYPEALLVLLAFGALLGVGTQRGGWVRFALSASLLVLLRATFQPAWALAVGAAVAWSLEGRVHARHWLALSLPLVLGLVLVVKNGALFGVWATSSWYGMNAAKLAVTAMIGEIPDLVAKGVVSPIFAVGPFQPVARYPGPLVQAAAREVKGRFGEVPALLVAEKSNGQPNFNHLVYRDVSRQLAGDSLAAARARRVLFDETVVKGLWYYVQPASSYVFLTDNRQRLEPLDTVYMAVLYPGRTFLVVRIALVVVMISSAGVALFGRGRFAALRPAATFVFVTTGWVTAASNLAEYGENMRLRFALDPMIAAWLLVVLIVVLQRRAEPVRAVL